MNDANLLCIRFDFGVPLEDIFPPNDVHPKLYNLFYETFVSFKKSGLLIEEILRSCKISIKDALSLKDSLVCGKLTTSTEITSSSYFWLLRHFFGLLPLPLFPKFTNGQFYNWHYLAKHSRSIHMRSNRSLLSEISWWIHKLPKANILLAYTLINFLRKIALKRHSLKKLDWRSVKMISLYFGACLFTRPFTPGLVTEMDSLYYPLLAYMIIHWHKIDRDNEDCFYFIDRQLSSIWEDNDLSHKFIRTQMIDCGCQTKNEESEIIESKKYVDLLFDKQKQTENKKNRTSSIEPEEEENENFLTQEQAAPTLDDENQNSVIDDNINNNVAQLLNKNTNLIKTLMPIKLATIKPQNDIKAQEETFDKNVKTLNFDHFEPPNDRKISTEPIITKRHYSDSPLYETIVDEKNPVKSSSETAIFKKKCRKFLTPKKIFHKKILTVNISLANVISKVNKKLKSKHEILHPKTAAKVERGKYNLLEDSEVRRVQSLHRNNFVTESPNIKYEKLKTL